LIEKLKKNLEFNKKFKKRICTITRTSSISSRKQVAESNLLLSALKKHHCFFSIFGNRRFSRFPTQGWSASGGSGASPPLPSVVLPSRKIEKAYVWDQARTTCGKFP
jgi:hypothetical protein